MSFQQDSTHIPPVTPTTDSLTNVTATAIAESLTGSIAPVQSSSPPPPPHDNAVLEYTSLSHLRRTAAAAVDAEAANWDGNHLDIIGRHFVDEHGRNVYLRGVNLCGNSKLPLSSSKGTSFAVQVPSTQTHHHHHDHPWSGHTTVTFIGRPFPLSDLHEHFSRLRHWGLTFIRLLVPWEAISHSGPSVYDEEYIGYLHTVISMMPKYGLVCFIDPHQDCWSRFTGGSGAPGWTLEVAGMKVGPEIERTGAAVLHNHEGMECCECVHGNDHSTSPTTQPSPSRLFSALRTSSQSHKPSHHHQHSHSNFTTRASRKLSKWMLADKPPPMLWPTNYSKLACASMFTLFFGGAVFAPEMTVDPEDPFARYEGRAVNDDATAVSIQDYLQSQFIAAYVHLAKRLAGLSALLGFEALNEPHSGYIGVPDLRTWDELSFLMLGDMPKPLDSFALGMGIPRNVPVYERSWPVTRKVGTRWINTEKDKIWVDQCPWLTHGVYTLTATNTPILNHPHYFAHHPKTGQAINFENDFYKPFVRNFAHALAGVDSSFWIMFEPVPNEDPPDMRLHVSSSNGDVTSSNPKPKYVYSPHWYELKAIFAKSFTGRITHNVQRLRKSKLSLPMATFFGISGAKRNFSQQISYLKSTCENLVGQVPVIIGECGIPMDMNNRSAFISGDYTHHANFLDAVLHAVETNGIGFTLWNYNTGNHSSHGDHWNGEDFSIFTEEGRKKRKSWKDVGWKGLGLSGIGEGARRFSMEMLSGVEGLKRKISVGAEERQVGSGKIFESPPMITEEEMGQWTSAEQGTSPTSSTSAGKKGIDGHLRVDTSSTMKRRGSISGKRVSLSPVSPFSIGLQQIGPKGDDQPTIESQAVRSQGQAGLALGHTEWTIDDEYLRDGGRVLDAVIRPYVCRCKGQVKQRFEMKKRVFHVEIIPTDSGEKNLSHRKDEPGIFQTVLTYFKKALCLDDGTQRASHQELAAATSLPLESSQDSRYAGEVATAVIFIPRHHFPPGQTSINVSEGRYEYSPGKQTLWWYSMKSSALKTYIEVAYVPASI